MFYYSYFVTERATFPSQYRPLLSIASCGPSLGCPFTRENMYQKHHSPGIKTYKIYSPTLCLAGCSKMLMRFSWVRVCTTHPICGSLVTHIRSVVPLVGRQSVSRFRVGAPSRQSSLCSLLRTDAVKLRHASTREYFKHFQKWRRKMDLRNSAVAGGLFLGACGCTALWILRPKQAHCQALQTQQNRVQAFRDAQNQSSRKTNAEFDWRLFLQFLAPDFWILAGAVVVSEMGESVYVLKRAPLSMCCSEIVTFFRRSFVALLSTER